MARDHDKIESRNLIETARSVGRILGELDLALSRLDEAKRRLEELVSQEGGASSCHNHLKVARARLHAAVDEVQDASEQLESSLGEV